MRRRRPDTLPAGMGKGGGAGRPSLLPVATIGLVMALLAVAVVLVAARPSGSRGVAVMAPSPSVLPSPAPSTVPTAAPTPRPTFAPVPRLAAPTLPPALDEPLPVGDGTPAHPSAAPTPTPPSASPAADASPGPVVRSREPEDLSGYDWPLYRGRMTSFFGSRGNGFLVVDGERIHSGLDTTTWCGDKVKAAHKGVVVAAGRRWAQEAGFRGPMDAFFERLERRKEMRLLPIAVVVDDGNGYRSVYVHLSKASVKVGQRVRKGQVIGLEGMTGNATGCHVHYELVRMDGPWMRVASALVREYRYPAWQRERVDPLRVLGMRQKRAGRYVPGIERPSLPPSLRGPEPTDG